ncbi:hypothetical protein A2999_00405 [Candidatus Wolfebacteria bacterium RIFCSPLOWO2_01_FULL_38_11]|uniref:Uncharacterized protein n=2 Tax=Candidatus Wolfeibacteriota TaxID=1752735 RepID=A0A0G0GAV9_9BACT|nr:MAG: hypothetical protein US36_C0003G0024 [Candidatus Wolfebacteria bacterium GW2011_GWC1_37_10]OGM90425.1 MAG: hypothetical protein A2999_00405 [Candidatus Wolfebacteria bacterium RIFCSPLOWO2_01_FULL_38_11]
MDEQFQTSQTNSGLNLKDKWFWVGIVIAVLNILAGIIYGITMLTEKERRKEGIIIIVWAIIWSAIAYFLVVPWLVKAGIIPKFQVIK